MNIDEQINKVLNSVLLLELIFVKFVLLKDVDHRISYLVELI